MYSNAATAAQLRDSYYAAADNIDAYIKGLKERISRRPPESELSDLELRLSVLKEERRELMETAGRLARLAAPPAPSPSCAARMKA